MFYHIICGRTIFILTLTNEKGLGIAGLNFVGNAYYNEETYTNKDNISSYELIPWILSQCATTKEARKLISRMNIIK